MQWVKLLEDNGIEYVTRGPNTRRGEISVKCPWCGDEDPSQHMGISLEGEKWGCLRNGEHRGNNPDRLVAALLGCNRNRARIIVKQYSRSDPDDLESALIALGEPEPQPEPEPEKYPPITRIKYMGVSQRFWNYIKGRGFGDHVRDVIYRYNLHCCVKGRYKDRIIIPFLRKGEIIAWTGRAITDPISAPRYLSSDRIKTTVFNEDLVLRGGQLLFITEGPFDAIKLDYYAQGAVATCLSGTAVSAEQMALLMAAKKKFWRVVILFDHDAQRMTFPLLDWLNAPNVVVGNLPAGVKDPAELTPSQIQHLTQEAVI